MGNLLIDWLWLYLQVTILLGIIAREFIRKRERNLFAILVSFALLVLFQGQAMWVFKIFEDSQAKQLTVAYNHFDLQSAREANALIGVCTIGYALPIWFSGFFRRVKAARVQAPQRMPHATGLVYSLIVLWVTTATYFLIRQVGGVSAAIYTPGQMIGGQTVFLLAVGLGKWPLILKIVSKQRIAKIDVVLYGFVLLVTLFNSRFLTVFSIVQLVLAINYCRIEMPRRLILSLAVPAFVIFFVFGIYRDFAYRYGTVGFSEAVTTFFYEPVDFNAGNWFYEQNVEGFTGIAGLLNFKHEQGGLSYDFGLSELAVFTSYVPNALREDPSLPFGKIGRQLKEMYPYSGSVVPSGLELSYGHLGFLGPVIYSFVLGILVVYSHRWTKRSETHRLLCILLSVQLLNGVRASLFGAFVFFGVSDLLMCYSCMFAMGSLARTRFPTHNNYSNSTKHA